MLPTCRTQEYLYPVPKFEMVQNDVKTFIGELKAFHGEFKDCFFRHEVKDNVFVYMAGQFSKLERKSIEPIAISMGCLNVRTMQHAISGAVWNVNKMVTKYRSMVNEDLGDSNGVLIFDECGYPKKGKNSAGVGKQYCGCLGKVENCQVGVFAAYASPQGYALVDKQLFIPEDWFTEESSERRKKCELPEDLCFKTKPQLAAEMFEEIHNEGILPYKYVVGDSIYGMSPSFIDAVEKYTGKVYFVSIPSDTQVWLNRPVLKKKSYRYKGEQRIKEVLHAKDKSPMIVSDFAKGLHNIFWYRRTVSEGTKGPIEYEFSKRQVVLAKDGLPHKTVWLVMKRTIGSESNYRFFISNAPVSTRLPLFVWLSGLRWPIEQCFEEAKGELGMDHYEVRKFQGWHHHMLVVMLAHFFLWHLKIRLGKKSTSAYSVAA